MPWSVESRGCCDGLGGATDVEDCVVESMLDAGQLAEHRVAADVQPRVVDDGRANCSTSVACFDAASLVSRRRSRPADAKSAVRGLVPRTVQRLVERVG